MPHTRDGVDALNGSEATTFLSLAKELRTYGLDGCFGSYASHPLETRGVEEVVSEATKEHTFKLVNGGRQPHKTISSFM